MNKRNRFILKSSLNKLLNLLSLKMIETIRNKGTELIKIIF